MTSSSSTSTQIKLFHQDSGRFIRSWCFLVLFFGVHVLQVDQRKHFLEVRWWGERGVGGGKETRDAVRYPGWVGSPDWCVWLRRALWLAPQTGLVLKSAKEPQICMLFAFQTSIPGMWNEMNEWTVFRLLVKAWTPESRPHWGSNHWSSLDQETQTQTETEQAVRETERQSERQTPSSPFSPGSFQVKARKQNPQNLF